MGNLEDKVTLVVVGREEVKRSGGWGHCCSKHRDSEPFYRVAVVGAYGPGVELISGSLHRPCLGR